MNSSPLASLFDMDQQRQKWNAEKPVFSGGNELRFNEKGGEMVFGYFVASGDDGERFIKLYKAHAVPSVSSKGTRFTAHKYCPVLSGVEGAECDLCDGGNINIKERMSMWFYITDIFHTILPKDKQLDVVSYGGRSYYKESINGFRVWHSSAWRESPWDDIVRFATMYKGLHNLLFNMVVSGSGTSRRYKIYAVPEPSFLPPEIYERAQAECRPIPELLVEGQGSATQSAPNTTEATEYRPGQAIQSTLASVAEPTEEEPSNRPLPPVQPEKDERRPLASMF